MLVLFFESEQPVSQYARAQLRSDRQQVRPRGISSGALHWHTAVERNQHGQSIQIPMLFQIPIDFVNRAGSTVFPSTYGDALCAELATLLTLVGWCWLAVIRRDKILESWIYLRI